jgi:hypothetical protein
MKTAPATSNARELPPAAISARRRESDLLRMLRWGDPVSHAADSFDQVDAELLAKAADKYLDVLEIAVEILVVKVFGQFGRETTFLGWCMRYSSTLYSCDVSLTGLPSDRHPARL